MLPPFVGCSGSAGGYVERNHTMLGNVPFTHVSGLWLFGTAFAVGATVVLIAKMELESILSAIEKYKVSARSYSRAMASFLRNRVKPECNLTVHDYTSQYLFITFF